MTVAFQRLQYKANLIQSIETGGYTSFTWYTYIDNPHRAEEIQVELVDLSELRTLVDNLVSTVQVLQEAVDRNYMSHHLRTLLEKHYDIGELVDVKKLDRGYVNVSYEIETKKGKRDQKHFLRRYKRGIREDEIKFEHSIVTHLTKKGFSLSAAIVKTRQNTTYVKKFENAGDVPTRDVTARDTPEGDSHEEVYFAVFKFLPGEDKYTWDNPDCSARELEDSARVLAQYHAAVSGLKYEGRRFEPKIIDLLPTIAGNMMKYAKRTGQTKFDAYFLKHLDSILSIIDTTVQQIDRDTYNDMPHLAIHCDYHPGNLKFKDEKVVGLFDFDWSKIDVRSFDVALAITYSCSSWEGKEDGDLLIDKLQVFLKSYQEEAKKHENPGPIAGSEAEYLPCMIQASNLYVLNWDVDDYYIKKPNPFEYLIYLQHSVRLMRWLEENRDSLTYVLKKVLDLP